MFTQLSRFFNIRIFWRHLGILVCLWLLWVFLMKTSPAFLPIECREGGEGEKWWEEAYFKMQAKDNLIED